MSEAKRREKRKWIPKVEKQKRRKTRQKKIKAAAISGSRFLLRRRGKCNVLAQLHLTTANQLLAASTPVIIAVAEEQDQDDPEEVVSVFTATVIIVAAET
ncbi:MAG: hypothetical protein ACI4EI_06860 [Muricoprocola sp.]